MDWARRVVTASALLLVSAVALGQLAPPAGLARRSCGTFWTGWVDSANPDKNPCPAKCERGDRLQDRQYRQGDKTLYDVQYQCWFTAPAALSAPPRLAPIGLRPAGHLLARPATRAAGTLTPDTGGVYSYVRASGKGIGTAASALIRWFPGDDDSQPAVGSSSVTIVRRHSADEFEFQVPNGAGGPTGGVVRLFATVVNQAEPVFVGRFNVTLGAMRKPVAPDILDRQPAAIAPLVVETAALQMMGRRPIPIPPSVIETAPLQMMGRRPIPIPPSVIETAPLQMMGRRPIPIPPSVIETAPLQMTGTRLRQIELPRRPLQLRPPPGT